MHVSGKVFAWLLILPVLLAMAFTAKTVKVRNSWAARLERSKKEYADLASKVVEAQFAADRAQSDWHRATSFWGVAVSVQTVVQNAADGTLIVELGTNTRLPLKQGQTVYGFELLADGSSVYRGDFVAATVRERDSLLVPGWRLRPGDTAGWQTGPWRWRLVLPPSYPSRFGELEQSLLIQDEVLAERRKSLAIQHDMVQTATEQLKLREAELLGGPELPQEEALEQEFREGLVAALETVEEQRNGQLIAIDRLRRSVRALRQEILAIQSQNRELVDKLPQPAAELTRKP
jgi:hypothetical protein